MNEQLTITMDLDDVREVLGDTNNNALRVAIVEAQAGASLEEFIIPEWPEHWPVIDRDLHLTGEVRGSGSDDWYNYDDEAAILRDEAFAAGWIIDDDGYANPSA